MFEANTVRAKRPPRPLARWTASVRGLRRPLRSRGRRLANPDQSVVPVTRSIACSASKSRRRRRCTRPSSTLCTYWSARPTPAWSISFIRTTAPGVEGRHGGDASSHEAAAEHGDLRHAAWLDGFGLAPRSLATSRVCAKKIDRSARDSEEVTSSPKNLASARVSRLRAIDDSEPHGLERPLRCRVVALRLGEELLAGLLEQDVETHRIGLQRQLLEVVAAQPGEQRILPFAGDRPDADAGTLDGRRRGACSGQPARRRCPAEGLRGSSRACR